MNLDKLKNLSKEQKQQLVLAVMVGCGLIYSLWQFGLQPILREQAKTATKIESLQEQQRKEKLLLNARQSTEQKYRELRDEIRQVMVEKLPPYENAMSWATELIGSAAAAAGMQEADLAINERGRGSELIRTSGRDAGPALLKVFRVGVDFTADYHTLGRFVAAIEKENPYAHVGQLTVKSRKRGGQFNLEVSLECVFPRFSRQAFPETAHPDAPLPAPPSAGNDE